jgi:2,4-dienoyl-CoA reductase-like NADH-dependent reductase (Old Yellow Enzyme family)
MPSASASLSEADALAVVSMLSGERIDLLEISRGRYESGAAFGYNLEGAQGEGYFTSFARRARALSDAPILLTGGLRSASFMRTELAAGSFDVAGLARPMLLDPHYPRALLAGRDPALQFPPRIRLERLESAAEMAYWYAQIARLGRGLAPAARLSLWRALAAYVLGDALEALRTRARRFRLGAPRLGLRGQS